MDGVAALWQRRGNPQTAPPLHSQRHPPPSTITTTTLLETVGRLWFNILQFFCFRWTDWIRFNVFRGSFHVVSLIEGTKFICCRLADCSREAKGGERRRQKATAKSSKTDWDLVKRSSSKRRCASKGELGWDVCLNVLMWTIFDSNGASFLNNRSPLQSPSVGWEILIDNLVFPSQRLISGVYYI